MAFDGEIDLVEASPGGDEERFEILAAEAEVGGSFGHEYFPDEFTVRTEDMDPIASAGIDASNGVGADSVRTAFIDLAEDLTSVERITADVENSDVAGSARVGDVKLCFIGREAEAVWLVEILYQNGCLFGFRIMAENPVPFDFAFILTEAVIGIGKPEGTIALDHDVIG